MSGSGRSGQRLSRRATTIALALVAALAFLCYLDWAGRGGESPKKAVGRAARQGEAAAGPAGTAGAPARGQPSEEPSHLADRLNAPDGDIKEDLRTLDEIFRQYRSSTRGSNPVGDNREVTAALAGRNAAGYSFIPPGHPAINAKGELCDRWGTPFFFHQLSGSQMEIRSAGPDRRLWTEDDPVLSPESGAPPL